MSLLQNKNCGMTESKQIQTKTELHICLSSTVITNISIIFNYFFIQYTQINLNEKIIYFFIWTLKKQCLPLINLRKYNGPFAQGPNELLLPKINVWPLFEEYVYFSKSLIIFKPQALSTTCWFNPSTLLIQSSCHHYNFYCTTHPPQQHTLPYTMCSQSLSHS